MGICPKDMKPCLDDLCYGSGCIYGMGDILLRCDFCGALCSDDIACDCDEDDEMWDEDE